MIVLKAGRRRLRRLAFSPDGRLLAAVGEAGTVLLWDVLTRQVRTTSQLCSWSLSHLAFTPDSKHLYVSGQQGLWRWPTDGGEAVRVGIDGGDRIDAMALSPRGDLLAVWRWRHNLTCHTENGGAALWRASPPGGRYITRVAFAPGGREVVSGAGSRISFYSVETGTEVRPAVDLPTDGNCLALSPDGSLLAAGAKVRLVVWRLEPREELATLYSSSRKHFQGCAFHPSGRLLAAPMGDGEVVLLSTATWTEQARLDWGVGQLLDVGFSPDGSLGACCSVKGQVVVWDVDE
jgi:WD40 repeat protein